MWLLLVYGDLISIRHIKAIKIKTAHKIIQISVCCRHIEITK